MNKAYQQQNRMIGFTPVTLALSLVLFIILSLWLIFQYAEKERNRDLMNWQSRLALLAEIRSTQIEDLIGSQKAQLNELALNPSLRLFLSQYVNKDSIDQSVLRAQRGHVRNLLSVNAEQFGFVKNVSQSHLNLQKKRQYGLAILGAETQLLLSSKNFPDTIALHKDVISKTFLEAKPQLIDLYQAEARQPVYGYVFPVFQIQDTQFRSPVGAVIILLDPREKLFGLLVNRQSTTKSDESLLVKPSGPSLVYKSVLKAQFEAFHQLPDNNNKLAASYAYHNPGGFSEMQDYQGEQVLVTGRRIQNTPWGLVQKISSKEALAESNKHQKFLLTTFSLFVLLISTAFIAIWRHSTSLRLRRLSTELETHTALLDAVSDNIRENIMLVDKDKKIIFINPVFAKALNIDAGEAFNKHLSSVLGVDTADNLIHADCSNDALCISPLHIGAQKKVFHVTTTELVSGEHKQSKLYVLHDISELKQEQEKREQLGRGIISTLVKAVDLHDPFCANHSERTREVALEIGKAMSLSENRLESLEMAALLANIGKIFVPKEILTKMEPLTDGESKELQQHIAYAVDILSELAFDGPVVDIIAQKNERLDGSGYPNGLSGNSILLESSILAVANAFVAMASSRAYRQGRPVKDVMDILLEKSEAQYDRHVVAALFHIAENKSDWETWQTVSES